MEKFFKSVKKPAPKEASTIAGGVLICLLLLLVVAILYKDRSFNAEVLIEDNTPSLEITVRLEGAVTKPGEYKLKNGTNVQDLLDLAGGLLPEADTHLLERKVDLQEHLLDGDRLYVPRLGEQPLPTVTTNAQLLNLNTASEEDIIAANLYRIGPVIAARIVAYRDTHGPFTHLEELQIIEGIGEVIINKLQGKVVFN